MTVTTALKEALKNLPSSEEEVASCSTSDLMGNKAGGITVNVEDYVAGAIDFGRVRVTSTVVKEISNASNCFLGTIRF